VKINLPHTWNAFDAVDMVPGYRRDASWYEKRLMLNPEKEKRYVLYFEGVNMTAEVYVNKKKAGAHIGGYLGFEIDITSYIKVGENLIQVRADNSINPDLIPSQKSDFILYGGITRDVWLLELPENYIKQYHISHVVKEKQAQTNGEIFLNKKIDENVQWELRVAIRDKQNKIVSSSKKKLNAVAAVRVSLPVVKNPYLWSTENPYLYTCVIELFKNNQRVDVIAEKIGYRFFEFKEHGAFYLNGKRLLLRGTHRHEEHAGFGAAVPDSIHVQDMKMIKEMGANFVRLAHYPQDPTVYKLCDSLGLLVWDEIPWCRGGIGGEVWKQNTERILREMILQNYNHPSIVMWSLGNELNWLPDVDGGDNDDSIKIFLNKLNSIVHTMDSGRVTCLRKYYPAANIVDVFSPSIWAGWYSGVYQNYGSAITDAQKKYKRFFHAEYGGDSHVGRHFENVSNDSVSAAGWEETAVQTTSRNFAQYGDWSESYIVDLFDWYLTVSENAEWFTGNAQWVFKDFATPLRPENPIPYINQKGLLDRNGKPKDAYYVFKSHWTDYPKFCYIESHTWTTRYGKKDSASQVCVYSNCHEIKLFLNDQDLGLKLKDKNQVPAGGLNWMVSFKEGKNVLKAVGYENKKVISIDTLVIDFYFQPNGPADNILLSYEKLSNGNYLITALIVDKNGKRCIDYNKRIYFSHQGEGKLMINQGTPTGSEVIEASNGLAQIEFVPGNGAAIIEARNQDFKSSYLKIEFR
ncbi:MAG: glycoside hydrolase family 2 protein, partial [Cytophagaceae bacterium]|nr:glycoside hydrolase family 2 protein [Cytophagaceae bacterium]